MRGPRAAGRGARARLLLSLLLLLLHLPIVPGCGDEPPPGPVVESRTDPGPAPSAIAGSSLLVVTLDTTRRDALGFANAGSSLRAATPALDALAKRSVEFTRAWTVAPITLPAHASLFTGLEPVEHGVRDNLGFRLPDSARTLAERLRGAGYATAAVVAAPVLAASTGMAQGFDLYDEPPPEDRVPERPAGAVTRAAGSALAQLSRDSRPFFLWVHYFDAHSPHVEDPSAEQSADRDGYVLEIERIDRQLGRLLATAQAASGRRPLLVVVVADHGEALGDHGEATHGHLLHEPVLRIPFLVSHPRFPPGRCSRVASVVDLVPTLLEALELPRELDVEAGPGRSLLEPLLEPGRRDDAEPRTIRFESRLPWHEFGWAWLDGACDGRFKWVDRPTPALFDLENDPAESRDCSAEHPERARVLASAARELDRRSPADRDVAGSVVDPALTSLGYVATRRSEPDEKSELAEPADRLALVELRDRGLAALWRGDHVTARATFEELRTRNPDPAPASMLLATSWSMEAESLSEGATRQVALEQAARAWRRAVEECPGDAQRRYNLAMTLLDLQRRDEAIQELERCVSLAPEDEAARRELDRARK